MDNLAGGEARARILASTRVRQMPIGVDDGLAGDALFFRAIAGYAARSRAAARSAKITARSWRIRPAGVEGSPLRRRSSAPTFSSPVTSHRICRAGLMIGYVNLLRRLPSLSPTTATST